MKNNKRESLTLKDMLARRPKEISRRNFLRFMGASSLMAVATCRRPYEQIVPAVARAPETQPGIASFYTTVAPDGTGLSVRTRSGRPIKILGNQEHPLTKGGVSASQVASLMDLYDPDRLRRAAVIKKDSRQAKYRPEELIVSLAQSKLKKGKYVILTGPLNSPSRRALVGDFLKKYPGGRHVSYNPDPTLRQIADGQEISYGKALVPLYRLDRSDLILSVDGDFLGAMPLSTTYTRAYSDKRELRKKKGKMNRLIVFESMYSVTGSNADERYAIRPGDQTLLVLALAAHIAITMGQSSYAKDPVVRRYLKDYLPSNIAKELKHEHGLYKKGHFERVITRIATELWDYRGRSLVIGGSPLAANGNNAASQIAINLLNSILENDGKSVSYKEEVLLDQGTRDREIQGLLTELHDSQIETLIIANANLLYHLPSVLKAKEALTKVKYILSLNDRIDETTRVADAILPTSHYLETWGDSEVIKGLGAIQQPVIRPLHKTRSFEDRLIQLAGGKLSGVKNFYELVKQRWRKQRKPSNFRKAWIGWLQDGHSAGNTSPLQSRSAPPRRFLTTSLKRLPDFSQDRWDKAQLVAVSQSTINKADETQAKAQADVQSTKDSRLYLGLYYNVQVGDGSLANNAYRQELPDPVTKIVWDNYLCLLPATARQLRLKQGSVVKLSTGENMISVPVHLQPGLHPHAALLALGYGRNSVGKIANGVGQNALELASTGSDSFALSGILANVSKTNKTYELASTQAIYKHNSANEDKAFFTPAGMHEVPYRGSSQHERPILRETTFQEFKTGNFELKPAAVKYPKKQELTEPWNYEKTHWHMSIDLNSCTGCGACVTSCNSENNIPMVGKDEVKVGREMHWLRIDRYFDGKEEEPQLAHQPMFCQHCENAPCENVCPVEATTHNSEGLNVMTYNRCIGTRYCSNNCPYKVRRFNWFENWNYWEGFERGMRDPQQLALNPDVTVRSRGVMEKCTFCVQRISSARQDAKVDKKNKTNTITDGAVQTACQEVCPTQAISFGNILDPKSEVSKIAKKDKRGYKVLDFLDVKPQVTYLAKVRNIEPESESTT